MVDITAEPDQETFDAESLPKLLKEFFNGKPSEDDENVNRNIADRKGKPALVKAKKQDVINQERDDEGNLLKQAVNLPTRQLKYSQAILFSPLLFANSDVIASRYNFAPGPANSLGSPGER